MRRLGPVALACLLVGLVAVPARADRRTDLEQLREAIEESRARVDQYEREERGLLEAVEALDRAAALLARDVAQARRRATAARNDHARVQAELAEASSRLAKTRRALSGRAVALYRAGELGAVRLLFSSGGLPEFLSRVAALRRLLGLDAELLERHRVASAELAEAELRARDAATRLSDAEEKLRQRSDELAGERARKRVLVRRLHADRTRERSALVELEKAARALEETLERLGEEEAPGGQPAGPPFAALRRRLDPPVDAPVVRGFGRLVDPEFLTETFHSGLLYAVPLGTPVQAVAAGRVRFAGWFRGYGKLVILDHGDGYFSVSGHLEEIEVAVGDAVAARQTVGRAGETGSLAGPRLYFEIRREAEALDPAEWLRPAGAR